MIKYILLLLFTFKSFGEEIRQLDLRRSLILAENAIKKNYYLASLPFIKEAMVITKSPNEKLDEVIDRVLEVVGLAQFRFLPEDVLINSNSLFSKVVLAKKLIDSKKINDAKDIITDINDSHYIASLAYQIRGTIQMLTSEFESARSSYKQCVTVAQKRKKQYKKSDTRYEYFEFIESTCDISIARAYYKEGKFIEALNEYSKVDMRSYLFPSSLLESAWTLYRLEDYQTSIGRTIAFRAPFLKDYFYPETEQLIAMSFFKICHWDEVKDTLKYFDDKHYNNARALIKYLDKNTLKESKVLQTILERKNFFKSFKVTDLIFNRIRNTPSFIYHSNLLHLGVKELKRIRAMKGKDPLIGLYYNNAKRELRIKSTYLGYQIKAKLYKVANEFIKASQVLSLLGIEVHGYKRDKLANRKPYEVSEVDDLPIVRTVSNVNWDFTGEFWSDEIGSYVWSKESRCPKQ